MKLYEAPPNSWVRIRETPTVPIASKVTQAGDVIYFDHLDGMYSYCIDKDEDIVHLAAYTEVEVLDEDDQRIPDTNEW